MFKTPNDVCSVQLLYSCIISQVVTNNSTIIIAFVSIREEPSRNVLPGIYSSSSSLLSQSIKYMIVVTVSIREEPSLNVLPGISSPPRLPSGPETTWIIFPSKKPQCMLVNVIPAVLYWLYTCCTLLMFYLLYFTFVMGTIVCWVDDVVTLWKYVS